MSASAIAALRTAMLPFVQDQTSALAGFPFDTSMASPALTRCP